jgi:hypothetical protein
MKNLDSTTLQCECGSIFPFYFDGCPRCGANATRFVEANNLEMPTDYLHREILCSSCNQSCPHYKTRCPSCNADPLAIKCECGFSVLFGYDCCVCGKDGFYNRQLMALGFSPDDFEKFTLCGCCRNAYGQGHRRCPYCKSSAVIRRIPYEPNPDFEESDGKIYILINPSMPNLVKIGKTTRAPEERAAELSGTTGIPTKFFVAYEVTVFDCDSVERDIHNRLSDFRVNEDREFFNIPLKTAIQLVEEIMQLHQSNE